MISSNVIRSMSFAGAIAAVLIVDFWPMVGRTADTELAAHRAVYELTLARSRGKSGTVAARGRILYDFSGNVCEGYKLEFRQVSELDNGEGRVSLSDLRSNTWEEGTGKAYQFKSQNFLNEREVDGVDGRAERRDNTIAVTLTKPKDRKMDLEAAILFPTEHVRHIIEAARDGKTILEAPVYDGSESGEKIYNTLTVIGREIPANTRLPTDAASGHQVLTNMRRWPMTVSYFDKAAKPGEQLPVYSISFEMYENGIARQLVLDYNDFAINGELKTLDISSSKPCP